MCQNSKSALPAKLMGLFEKLDEPKRTELRISLNQFYEGRIETLRTRLWSTLSWLAAAQGGALVLTINMGGLRTTPNGIEMREPILIVLLALFGIILACYTLRIMDSGIEHLGNNFNYSNAALDFGVKDPKVAAAAGARDEPYLTPIRILANVAFWLELILLGAGVFGLAQWLADLGLAEWLVLR